MRIPVHIGVCYLILGLSFVHVDSSLAISKDLSLASPIVLDIVAYLPMEILSIYFLLAVVTRKSPSQRNFALGAIALVSLFFAGTYFPDWLLKNDSHRIEISRFLKNDEMFLPPDVVKRFEDTFNTPPLRSGCGEADHGLWSLLENTFQQWKFFWVRRHKERQSLNERRF